MGVSDRERKIGGKARTEVDERGSALEYQPGCESEYSYCHSEDLASEDIDVFGEESAEVVGS